MRTARRKRTLLASSLVLVVSAGVAPDSAGADPDDRFTPSASRKKSCKKVPVAGTLRCVRRGARCRRRFNRYYLPYGLSCKRRKLRRASLRERRGREVAIADPRTGLVPKEVALQAFVAVYGPLPGVHRERGAVGKFRSGSGPLRWIQRVRNELTPKQRRAVDALIERPRGSARAQGSIYSQGQAQLLLNLSLDRIRQLTNSGPLPFPAVVQVGTTSPDVYADSLVVGFGSSKQCRVRTSSDFQNLSPESALVVMAHEAWHCFQYSVEPALGYRAAWVVEGQAEYAGLEVARQLNGGTIDPFTAAWPQYLLEPQRPLFLREYSAIGYWASEHGDRFLFMPWMLKPPTAQGAYDRYLPNSTVSAVWRGAWAASPHFRKPQFGLGWDVTGPGLTNVKPPVPEYSVANGETVWLHAGKYANELARLDLKADAVSFDLSQDGVARIRFDNGDEHGLGLGFTSNQTAYCLACGTCPSGKVPVVTGSRSQGIAHLGLSGGKGGGTIKITGRSTNKQCMSLPQEVPHHRRCKGKPSHGIHCKGQAVRTAVRPV